MEQSLELADYGGFEERRKEAAARGKLRGMGIAYAIEQAAAPIEETAEIRFDGQGNCAILMGTLNQGQGHDVTFKQLINEQLNIPLEQITLVQGDTDIVAHGRGTFGSRSAGNGGAALHMAGDRIIEKGKTIAAHMLEAAEADIVFDDGMFSVTGTDRGVAIQDVAKTAYALMVLPPGIEPTLTAQADLSQWLSSMRAGNRSRHRHHRVHQLCCGGRCGHGDQPVAAQGTNSWRHQPGARPGHVRGYVL